MVSSVFPRVEIQSISEEADVVHVRHIAKDAVDVVLDVEYWNMGKFSAQDLDQKFITLSCPNCATAEEDGIGEIAWIPRARISPTGRIAFQLQINEEGITILSLRFGEWILCVITTWPLSMGAFGDHGAGQQRRLVFGSELHIRSG